MIRFDDFAMMSAEQRAALKRWESLTWTILCPLPSGATVSRTYFRDSGKVAASGISLPFESCDPLHLSRFGGDDDRADA